MTECSFTRRSILGMFGATALVPLQATARPLGGVYGQAFGTDWGIIGPEQTDLTALRPDIMALFEGFDRGFSPWRADSEISRLNGEKAGTHVASAEMTIVSKAALEIAEASNGAFDPTVGPLVAQWGFGPIKGGHIPDWRGVSVNANTIGKTHDDLTLDLCGIAKGRALDLAAINIVNTRLENALIDLGGELTAIGQHPSGRAWQVAVEHPLSGDASVAVLALPDGRSVATSGVREHSYALNGQTWAHIIDPVTRQPVIGDLRSVTVVDDTAMMADGWATALFAAGDTNGPSLASKMGIDALFLFERDGNLHQHHTGDFQKMMV